MKWVMREYVHLDRVASPWLIKRFVDRDATYVFVKWGEEDSAPADATPLALPGARLGPHDATGSTFDKIVRHYAITDAAVLRLGRVVSKGVAWVLEGFRPQPDDEDGQTAVGLLTLAEGMMLVHQDDNEILSASYGIYDALYASYRAHALMAEQGLKLPHHDHRGPTLHFEFLRGVYNKAAN